MPIALPLLLAFASPSPPAHVDIDLAGPMHTRSPWRLIATQGSDIPDPVMQDGGRVPGPVRLCLTRDAGRSCLPAPTRLLVANGPRDDFDRPHDLLAARIVRAGGTPLLLLKVGSLHSVNGDQRIATALYAYDRAQDRFVQVFAQTTGRNNNQEVRFVERGPLAGRIVSAVPTGNAPFGYWIAVSARDGAGSFRQVLRYRSAVRYGDGDRRAVIDAELPAIERRLHGR